MRPGLSILRRFAARPVRVRVLSSLFLVSFLVQTVSFAAEAARENGSSSAAGVTPEAVQQTFLKGKAFYDAGDNESALRVWQTLDPYLDAYPSIRKVVDYLKKRAAGPSPGPTPADIPVTLEKAAEQMAARRDDAQKAQDALGGKSRDEWIRAAFEKGRAAAEEGDWAVAIEEWDRLASYLDESSPERRTLEALKRDYFASEKLRAETRRQIASSKSKIKAPRGLAESLEQAKAKLRADLATAENQTSAAGKARSEREAWVDATLVRARAAYEEGRIEPAILEWEKALPYLENEDELREKIKTLRENLRALDDARSQNDGASAEAFARIKVPLGDRLSAEIMRATDMLRGREGRALEQQKDVRKSLAEREEWIAAQFEKGRQFLDAGRTADALAQWEPILPNVEGGEELRSSFDRVRAQLKAAESAETAAARQGEDTKFRAPAELTSLIEKATKDLSAKRSDSEARLKDAETRSAKRQKEVAEIFEKGRNFYMQDKYWEAAEAWKSMLPMVEESPQLEKWISQFETAYREYLDSKGAVDKLSGKNDGKYSAPADIIKLLTQAQKEVEARTAALVAERASMEKGKSEHEAWAKDTFVKGKTLYQQGRVDLAVDEWEKLLPHLEESSPERALILELRRQRDLSASAGEKIGELSASVNGRIAAPSDLKLALEAAIDASRAKERESDLERQAIERSIGERRDAMLQILQNGKDAFDAGRPADGLNEWKKLLQYVDARSKIDETLKAVENAVLQNEEARNRLAEAKTRGGSRFEPPDELAVAIQQAADRVAASAAKARAEQSDLEKDYSQRKLWMDQTYQAGKQHYAAGRLEEAVEEWAKLGPYLPEETGLAARLAQLKGVKDDAMRAKKDAVEAAARQYKGLRVDPQMENFLADASKDLRTQTIQSEKDRAKSDETFAANQKKTDAILLEGKKLYDAGDAGAAIVTWSALLQYLPEESASRRSLVELRQRWDDLQKMRRTNEDAQKRVMAGIEAPADFVKLADEARKRLELQQQSSAGELEKFQAARSGREKGAAQAYESAKAKFWDGDIAGAIAEWKRMAAEVNGAPAIVQQLEVEWAQTQKAKDAAAAAEKRAGEKLAAPVEFAKEIEAARQKVRAQTDALLVQKTKSEGARLARQDALQKTYERGKTLYWSGKVPEALEDWKNVTASVDDEKSAQAFAELLKTHAKLLEAQTASEAAAAAAAGKLTAPAELPKLLALAIEKTNGQTAAALAEKAKMTEDLAARRAAAEAAYQKGASAAGAGQYDQALAEWRNLTPYVDAQAGVGPALDGLEKAIEAARAARQDTDAYAAGEFKDIRFAHGDEIKTLVSQMEAKLLAAKTDAEKRRADMQKTFTDRQAWVESTFQRGKTLFGEGRYTDAVEFWKSLSPYLVDGTQITAMLDQFSRLQAEAAAAVADAADAESRKDTRFASPQELPAMLAAATEKIKTIQFEARTRRENVEQALSARRVAIQQAFDRGKAAFEKGTVPGALDEWEKMLPMVENEAAVKNALTGVRAAYQQAVQAKEDAAKAEASKDMPLPVPPELRTTLEQVTERMKKEIQSSELLREKNIKALADRRAYVRDIFDRGKALYEQGKLREAFDLWKTIAPFTEEEEKLNEYLSKAGQAYEGFVAAKNASHEAALQQSMKLQTPPDLAAILDDAIARLKQDDFDLRNKTFEIEKSIADRREWINSTFKKGQSLYIEGRYAEAVAEWNTILPYLGDGLDVKAKLVEIDKNAALAEKSRAILAESQQKLKLQFNSPKELSELLLKADEDLKNQMFSASAEKMKAEQTLTERQKWLNQTFELGRAFLAEGKISEALAEWSKLKPYLEGQPAIEEMMKTLQTNYAGLQDAKKAAVEAAAEDYKGMKLAYTDQMSKVLQGASQKIADETTALRAKLDKTHETLAERKEWSVTTFNKGKVFYDEGRYSDALEQWKRLLPYLEKDSEIKMLIENFQKSFAEWSDRSSAITELEQRTEKPVELAQPETMALTFKDAAQKMKAQADAASARAADLEKALTQRREWIQFTYDKGKKLFDQGKYAEAVTEWGVLGPYLSEHPDVREQIEDAKRSYLQFRKADQILQNAQTKNAALPALPEGAEVPPPAAPAEPAAASAPVSAQESAPAESQQTAASAEPAAELQLISGEIVGSDRAASTFNVKLVGASEMSIQYDGSTQFDGGSGIVSADNLQIGASVDVRVTADGRATYVYFY